MAYVGKVPLSGDEFYEGHSGDQASYLAYHSGSYGKVYLGFDQIVDEVNNEFFFYGSSHLHHPEEEHFFTSDIFSLNVPEQQLCSQPSVACCELHSENFVPHWQQGSMSPKIGFKSSLLSDDGNFSLVDSYPYNQEREIYRWNSITPVTNVFNSNVERSYTYWNYQIGFDNIDAQCPVSLNNYPFGQRRDENGKGETCLTSTSRRFSIGPTWPNSPGHDKEITSWSIQLIKADQGSNENVISFCNTVEKIRNAYPACDLKTNSGKIWSVVSKFPDNILGKIRFRISIWTDSSPSPLLLTQHAGCITHDLIGEILRCTNQYPVHEECFLSVCGSDEVLQNNHSLGSHESLRKATTDIHLHLHTTTNLKQSLARMHEDDQNQFSVNELLEYTCAWRLTRQNLVAALRKYRGQVEHLLQNEKSQLQTTQSTGVKLFSFPHSLYF